MYLLVGYVTFTSAEVAREALIDLQGKTRVEGDREYVVMAKVSRIFLFLLRILL